MCHGKDWSQVMVDCREAPYPSQGHVRENITEEVTCELGLEDYVEFHQGAKMSGWKHFRQCAKPHRSAWAGRAICAPKTTVCKGQ